MTPTQYRAAIKGRTQVDKRIDEICDERSGGGDFFVYLKPGFAINENPHQHCFGARTRADIKREMKGCHPCNCEDCQKESAA